MEHKANTPLADEYLQSLEGMEPAALPPFFYTRLKAKMEPAVQPTTGWALRPVLAVALLSVVLLLNVLTLAYRQQNKALPQSNRSDIEQFATDFNLSAGSNY